MGWPILFVATIVGFVKLIYWFVHRFIGPDSDHEPRDEADEQRR